MKSRRDQAQETRDSASRLAALRPHPHHCNNGEEYLYRNDNNIPSHLANFTKGLAHDDESGLVANARDYELFVTGIQSGREQDLARTPLGPRVVPSGNPGAPIPDCPSEQRLNCRSTANQRRQAWRSFIAKNTNGRDGERGADVRAWESAGAGLTFELEGPDPQAVTMPPAPRLDSAELAAEVAEVYWMALLRDVPFVDLEDGGQEAQDALAHLESLPWFDRALLDDDLLSSGERSRRGPRLDPGTGKLSLQHLFRGQTPGETVGPYLSQFLLIGNNALGDGIVGKASDQLRRALGAEDGDLCLSGPERGRIMYGALRINQRVRAATSGRDYMTTWESWLDVQEGAGVGGVETYECESDDRPLYRFISRPRDLATYVHYDALYEAYLNACLILLAMGAPFDRGVPFQEPDLADKQQGFAHFGGPHILTLVCEVATRALKAVRYQKFNIHRRFRPEGVGGRLEGLRRNPNLPSLRPVVGLRDAVGEDFLGRIFEHNEDQNQADDRKTDGQGQPTGTHLLPMAFPEGSPMHPSYGAGHATVAAACVTVLKAYFDHGHRLCGPGANPCYRPNADGSALDVVPDAPVLTVEGELNKLAGNISIGRNWAGVHYYTDYIESMRMGERIAIGLLEEQKLTYGENFSMTVPLFDGGALRI
jgi:hypothetical protein